MLLGFYDREAAAAVFEPVRALMEERDDRQLSRTVYFLGWSIFDPRAAVARFEQALTKSGLEPGANVARERVAGKIRPVLRGSMANGVERRDGNEGTLGARVEMTWVRSARNGTLAS